MKNGSLVSIIVPVYNTRNYLKPCVDSIRAQTYTNLEVILVDDGSTDGCGKLCDAFALEDPRIQVIHQENSGVSSARNAGLDLARGAYIYFVDSDDRVAETMVEESVAVMEAEDCDLCAWRIRIENEENASKSRCLGCPKTVFFRFSTVLEKQKFLTRWILNNRLGWSACCQAFRRDVIERHQLRFLPGQKICEDIDFYFRYAAYCRSFRGIPKPFYIYRQHAGSTMHTSVVREQAAWKFRIARSWGELVSVDMELFRPVYIFSGIFLSTLLTKGFFLAAVNKRKQTQILNYYLEEDRDWLTEQARLALKNRAEILRICGLPLGLRVCGFYKSLLTGDILDFYKAFWLQAGCRTLLNLKRNLASSTNDFLLKIGLGRSGGEGRE